MSWDITIHRLPDSFSSVDEIPGDYQPQALGPRSSVIADILKSIPDVDFSDPSWGRLDRETFSIEFNMGSEEICDGCMLHVRGGGDAMRLIDHLLKSLNWRGIDCQSGDFFTPLAASETFSDWQQFRDKVTTSQ